MNKDAANNFETEALNKPKKIIPKYYINRDVLTHENVIQKTRYISRDKSILYAIREYWFNLNCLNIFKTLIPIIEWLPKYSIKNYFINDLIAGLTVAVMHIPQGLAYGILAGLTAGVGLYMAFFPVLIYVVFGTSRHISMGTFAVVSLMTLKVVQNHATVPLDNNKVNVELNDESTTLRPINIDPLKPTYTSLEVATALTMLVGIMHFLMGFARLGTLASLLSEPLTNGFTTGAAVHVITTQIKDILGVKVQRYKGAFKIIYTLRDYVISIQNTNIASLTFSLVIMVFLIIMNEILRPKVSKLCRFPIPSELIAVITGTLVSRYWEFGTNYNVKLVGEIPLGLPTPGIPPISLFSDIILDAFAIAMVTFSVVMSMGLLFARKRSYEVNANQELFALGSANIFGGFFSCIPIACSLSRSLIQEKTGGETQIASVISAIIILLILLFIGPFFETLPRCVLAAIILVALKTMIIQVKDLKRFAKQGKVEAATWILTFIGVVFIDIDIGLLIGFLVSLLGFYVKGCKSYHSLLGTIEGTGVYVDLKYHQAATEIPKIKIFRYSGSINFATYQSFRKTLYTSLDIGQDKLQQAAFIKIENGNKSSSSTAEQFRIYFNSLIFDLSTVAHVDYSGCKALTDIIKELNVLNVQVYFSNPADKVYDSLMHGMTLGEGPFEILSSIHDAVLYAQANQIII